ncbi:unnamed protein product [Leuciscus chuanchicus]
MYTSKASHEDTKYIVFENFLLELFETCPVCSRDSNIQPRSNGTFLAIDQLCPHCEYFRQWKSQPCVGSTPVGNLQLSASLYFSGASFFQMKKVFESMHLKMFKYRTFRRHASMYLEPLIIYKWKKEQVDLVKDLCEADKVIIGGDMRADSPGHSAKYGSYTTMDLQKNLIIDIQLVQSNEVGGSYHMEKEGLKRSLEWLEECGVRLDCIVTDRHPQIQKFLKERNVTQYYDVWHLEKGPEKVAKWKSLINHIQDVHIHDDPLYPQCEHSHRVSKGSSKRFKPGKKGEREKVTSRGGKRKGKAREKNQTHDSAPPSASAPWRSRGRDLAAPEEIINKRAVQDVPGGNPASLLRTVSLPIH